MKTNNISIRHLRALCEIADQQSFTLAAQALHVTQSTLTTTIKQLENQVGLKLFDRTTRKVYLTDSGVEFLPTAKKLLSDFDVFMTDLAAKANTQTGSVAVAASPSMMSELLPEAICAFSNQYPNIDVTLIDTNALFIEQYVLNNQADFGIGSNHSNHNELEYIAIIKDRFGVIQKPVSQNNALEITWEECSTQPLLELTTDTGISAELKGLPIDAANRQKVSASSPNTIASLVNQGLGMAILPALAASTAAFNNLKFLPLKEPQLERTLYLIQRKGRAPTPSAERMKDIIHQHLKHAQLPEHVIYACDYLEV